MLRIISSFILLLVTMSCHSIEAPTMVTVEEGLLRSDTWGDSIEIEVNSFEMSIHEVTVGEWKTFVEDTGLFFDWERNSRYQLNMGGGPNDLDNDLPIFNITWVEATKYCNWLSRTHGYDEVYSIEEFSKKAFVSWNDGTNGYRLPTEVEWEFAARGGNLSTGKKYSGGNDLDRVAWHRENSDERPHIVMTKKSNELGIFDMTGNMAEWCWDFFDIDYTPHINGPNRGPSIGYAPDIFPTKDMEEGARVVRGGSWFSSPWKCEVNYRGTEDYLYRAAIGFRIVRSLD